MWKRKMVLSTRKNCEAIEPTVDRRVYYLRKNSFWAKRLIRYLPNFLSACVEECTPSPVHRFKSLSSLALNRNLDRQVCICSGNFSNLHCQFNTLHFMNEFTENSLSFSPLAVVLHLVWKHWLDSPAELNCQMQLHSSRQVKTFYDPNVKMFQTLDL